jgi:hypothetical protein
MGITTTPPDHSTTAGSELLLERNFKRFDAAFFTVCTVAGLATIGAVASGGAQALTWMVFLGERWREAADAASSRRVLGGWSTAIADARLLQLRRASWTSTLIDAPTKADPRGDASSPHRG